MNWNTVLKVIVAMLCVVALFACALVKHYLPDVDLSDVRMVALAGLTAMGVWHAAGGVPNPNERGAATLTTMILFAGGALVVVLALAGCTTTTSALYAGAEAAAVKGIKSADDNLVVTLRSSVCGLPYSAVQRDATMAAAVDVLCGPLPKSTGAVLATMSVADMAAVLSLARAVNAPPPK